MNLSEHQTAQAGQSLQAGRFNKRDTLLYRHVSHLLAVVVLALGGFTSAIAQTQSSTPLPAATGQKTPAWAFPLLGTTAPPSPINDDVQHKLEGSASAFTKTQLFDLFTVHDWFPDQHPPMPEVVARGRKPEVRACAVCHYPNGQGRPENAPLAGLPVDYIVQQMRDYQTGKRRSSEAKSGPHLRMTSTAQNVNEDDILQAARYFASQKYQPWIKVVETAQVPKTKVMIGSIWAASGEEGMEPIGQRIVEIPIDLKRTELRDPRIGFVAYVPEGSIRKGEALVTTGGGGRTLACLACHGSDLKGVGNIPPIAGRSAQYLARQLYDMQKGTRDGVNATVMKPVVEKLSEDDIINIVAYVSSRAP